MREECSYLEREGEREGGREREREREREWTGRQWVQYFGNAPPMSVRHKPVLDMGQIGFELGELSQTKRRERNLLEYRWTKREVGA